MNNLFPVPDARCYVCNSAANLSRYPIDGVEQWLCYEDKLIYMDKETYKRWCDEWIAAWVGMQQQEQQERHPS